MWGLYSVITGFTSTATRNELELLLLDQKLECKEKTARDNKSYDVDIIALHTQQDHGLKTWTQDDGAFRLRDLLLASFPEARMYTYGYLARNKSRWVKSRFGEEDHALGLLNALLLERLTANVRSNRPTPMFQC